jgi:hypothetical protein
MPEASDEITSKSVSARRWSFMAGVPFAVTFSVTCSTKLSLFARSV